MTATFGANGVQTDDSATLESSLLGLRAKDIPVEFKDPTTDALNIPGFAQAYAQAVAQSASRQVALWYLDIRNFRSVNPRFGFVAGDAVLQAVVTGAQDIICHDFPVGRLGADRFVLLSDGLDFKAAQEAFDKLCVYLNDFAQSKGIDVPIVVMAGIYYLRDSDYQALEFKGALDYASIAHRKAHAGTKSHLVLFSDEDFERDRRRVLIEQTFEKALAEGQIEVWYQPQVDYTYGEVIGAEALARWNHPELGWISPAEFVPVLEACGKVHDLDLFVWEEACRNAGRWRSVADGKPVPISVNVSRTEMYIPDLLSHFIELRQKYSLPEGSLHLEVTESAFIEDSDRLFDVVETFCDESVVVEMDDFGSGLSSLSMLESVPVDVVKLDVGFMNKVFSAAKGGVVLGSVIRMLQGLGTPIIAEGVETLEQAEALKNMGCHLMQGYHFSHPMPIDEFESFISSSGYMENAQRLNSVESNLGDLLSPDVVASFLFNKAIGGTMFFFVDGQSSESIVVNDKFYEECGLKRDAFGDRKINPIAEIDEASRETLWRAAAEAREKGSALCKAQVRLTGRWFEGVMRYIMPSSRGDVYSLNITRSGNVDSDDDVLVQTIQDSSWNLNMLTKIVPNGFVKCALNQELKIDYLSANLFEELGLSREEFMLRFHDSLVEIIAPDCQQKVVEAIRAGASSGELVEAEFFVNHGFVGRRAAQLLGKVETDAAGKQWLYALMLLKEFEGEGDEGEGTGFDLNRTIPFDYFVDDDRLVIYGTSEAETSDDIEIKHWLEFADSAPELVAPASAAKVASLVRDLKGHPISGFTDIKCNLRGQDSLQWFHINYTCETDKNGATTVIHGYAQDANDQMGSATWWRQRAERDYLTGLYNRTAIEQEINTAIHRSGGGVLFMVDLDNFKRVNDELGHLTGDALLQDVAKALERQFRESDMVGRYGGDEFVAFMPAAPTMPEELAEIRANNIVEAIGSIGIPDGTHAACSVGVAVSHSKDASFYSMLQLADQAMYESKQRGKGSYTIRNLES